MILMASLPMAQGLPADKLAPLVGSWIARRQKIVEAEEGIVSKFLGDALLAH